ncbi:MAG: DUF3192 domain-containing protein [Candidatus Omnitrophica bacterium]|nr:DUF3192 domain-containing protein [Candidatus Omnitrophota bacterium]
MNKIFVLFFCLLLSGCAATMSQVTAPNRKNLLKLVISMPKEEALNVMGTKSFMAGGFDFFEFKRVTETVVTNPYRSEILQGKDKTLEVIYYVTDVKRNDNAVTDDELTPLVFDNGKLIGWGWSFLQDNAQKYEIRIR